MRSHHRCCVPDCHESAPPFHRFPRPDNEVYHTWIKRINKPEFLNFTHERVYRGYRVCNKHFSKHCRYDKKYHTSRLYPRSLPVLHLPDFNEPPTYENSIFNETSVVENSQSTEDMSEETKVIVRKAEREDMHQVFQLIRDLAEFEKLEDQVKINVDTLIKDGFDSDSSAFKCFVAEVGSEIIGFALYYICYSTWLGKSIFLEDLYVKPSYRNCKIGKELILSVAKVAYETNSKRLDFHVLSWNPAAEFYTSLGAVNLTETEKWQLYRINEDGLNKLFQH